MPIIDLQRRIRELGRIRMGDQVQPDNGGRPRPRKLDKFRLTSPQQSLIEAAAEQYGGECEPWRNDGTGLAEYEVYIEAEELPCHVPPGDPQREDSMNPLSQWMEMWSGGGCQRRCDFQVEQLRMVDCICRQKYTVKREDGSVDEPATRAAIADAAKRPKKDGGADGCVPVTRLAVFLPELPGMGVWRLESHGWNAANEISGVAQLLAAATAMGKSVPATLRITRRRIKRPGSPTRDFIVPALDVPETLGNVLEQLGMPLGAQLPAPRAAPALAPGRRGTERVPLGDQYELPAGQVGATPGIGQHAPPIPDAPDPAGIPDPDQFDDDQPYGPPPDAEPSLPPPPISERERRRLMAKLTKLGWNDDDMRHLVIGLATAGETESSTELDIVQYDQVITILDLVVYGLITLTQTGEGDDAFCIVDDGKPGRPIQLPVDVARVQQQLANLPTPEGYDDWDGNGDAVERPDSSEEPAAEEDSEQVADTPMGPDEQEGGQGSLIG